MTAVLNDVDVRARIRRYIEVQFLETRPDVSLRDEDWLMNRGIVDSLGAIQLIKFLQAEFGVEIRDDEITEDNLGSVAALTRFVIGKRGPSLRNTA